MASREEAEASVKDGKLIVARERFARCALSECAEALRNKCGERRDEVDRAIPTVAFGVHDSLGRDVDAVVTLDGQPTPVPVGRTTKLDPGIHDVTWSTGSREQGHQKLAVFEGQRGRTVILGPADTPPAPERDVLQTNDKHSPWPWVVIGTGAFLLTTATVFQLVALREDSDRKSLDLALMHDDLTPSLEAMYEQSRESHRDAATTNQTIAITLGAVSLTALAAGITWAVVRAQQPRPRTAPNVGSTPFSLSF